MANYEKRNSSLVIRHSSLTNGFGLIEIVIVTAIITTALFAFSQAGILAVKLLRSEKENLEAALLAQETLEAVRSVRDESWTNNIAPLSNGAPYVPIAENSKWKLVASSSPAAINGKYVRSVVFDEVRRDGQDQISSSGTVDSGTRRVTARVEWRKGLATTTAELITYITDFQGSLSLPQETKAIFFEDATTDGSGPPADFPANSSGSGDPAQSFTTVDSIQATKVELFLRRVTSSPSNIYVELRTGPTGTVLGTSNVITSSTISDGGLSWVEFRFPNSVTLSAATTYYIRLRSIPASTDAGSGSQGTIHWGYKQTAQSPYGGGMARRYIGRLSNPNDSGQLLDQYDFGFRIYALQ